MRIVNQGYPNPKFPWLAKYSNPVSRFRRSKYENEDPLLKAENRLDTILQITVLSCFACATQLVDLFPNVGRSFLIAIPTVLGSTRNGKHSPKCKCAPKCFPLCHRRAKVDLQPQFLKACKPLFCHTTTKIVFFHCTISSRNARKANKESTHPKYEACLTLLRSLNIPMALSTVMSVPNLDSLH